MREICIYISTYFFNLRVFNGNDLSSNILIGDESDFNMFILLWRFHFRAVSHVLNVYKDKWRECKKEKSLPGKVFSIFNYLSTMP
jgi:hypothetical protein